MDAKTIAVIGVLLGLLGSPAWAQDNRALDTQRYDEVAGLVVDLDARIGEAQQRLARAQADGDEDAVERIRNQIRVLLIRRDSASFERQLLEVRHGEELAGRRAAQDRAASGGIVVDMEAQWRRQRVAEARRAIAGDLRALFIEEGNQA